MRAEHMVLRSHFAFEVLHDMQNFDQVFIVCLGCKERFTLVSVGLPNEEVGQLAIDLFASHQVDEISKVRQTHYAVQTKTIVEKDEPFDRLDDGTQWSARHGQRYSYPEALRVASKEFHRLNSMFPNEDVRLLVRGISEWEVMDWEPVPLD